MYTRLKLKKCILPLLLIISFLLPAAAYAASPDIPDFSGDAVIELNHNVPTFLPGDIAAENYEDSILYSELDALGRTGPATACLSRASLPAELRAESGDLRPTGWQTARYDDVIEGRYLYSLCHVIAPALSGAGSDPRNVFTGTRYLHTEGMRPFEDRIADYLRRTANHVLYRVTPVYRGDDPVASGVQLEAYSAEDAGRAISFNVFVYNIQPGIEIDYRSGDSIQNPEIAVTAAAEDLIRSHQFSPPPEMVPPSVGSFAALAGQIPAPSATAPASVKTYIVDTHSHKYHTRNCGHLPTVYRAELTWEEIIEEGYTLCGYCAQ